jgi:YidC/Oxa1 family membrane protein insertase
MDQTRRLVLFLAASALLLLGWNALFPPPRPVPATAAADSATAAPAVAPRGAPSAAERAAAPPVSVVESGASAPERWITVRSPLYAYRFSTRGAALNAATLQRFDSYVQPGERVQLVPRSARDVLASRVVAGADTFDFRGVPFEASADSLVLADGDSPVSLRFVSAPVGSLRAEITYTFRPDDYLVDVDGRIVGAPAGARLVTELGTGLAQHDDRDHGSARELAVVGWSAVRERVERRPVRKIAAADTIGGPLAWAGLKDRYFLIALLQRDDARFTRVDLEPAPNVRYAAGNDTLVSPRARARVEHPLGADGAFRLQAYLGPQEHGRLVAAGHELHEVNPYGYRWLRPVVRPIAAAALWLLNGMHDRLGLAYGWVLIIFGVLVRLATWPLNARAMRSQMKNMAVQPQLQARMKEVQAKYAGDPQRMQREMMGVYQELGVTPFSMLSGCLPLLIPMPVLITLFFVFQSAIEFRGTGFAWLGDLSLRDPLYVLPVFLMLSMFLLQWISTKLSGMEQNEQTRMMMYMMPIMMGAFFFVMPSGLNLYYASTNVASFPQQILIARERRRTTDAQKAADARKAAAEKKETRAANRARKR